MDVQFSRLIEWGAHGRNGGMHQTAITITKAGSDIRLHPITSKNIVGAAYLSIPREDIPAVIKALIEVS